MYNIAICDDQIDCGEMMELNLKGVMQKFDISYDVDIFTSGTELLNQIKSKKKEYDILFLDIIMADDDLNGMELAKEIRKVDELISIVFVTSSNSTDFMLDGYNVRALQYLLKPVEPVVLYELMQYELKNKSEDYIVFKEKEATKKVAPSNIVHIETSGRNVKVVLQNGEFFAYNKISDVEKLLSEKEFIRCHQSFIVNINNVVELRHGEAITTRDESIPISRTQWSAIKKMFTEKGKR